MNDYPINVRMPRDLAIRSREIANEQGMTFSAFTRQALLRNVRTYIDHERDLIARRVVR